MSPLKWELHGHSRERAAMALLTALRKISAIFVLIARRAVMEGLNISIQQCLIEWVAVYTLSGGIHTRWSRIARIPPTNYYGETIHSEYCALIKMTRMFIPKTLIEPVLKDISIIFKPVMRSINLFFALFLFNFKPITRQIFEQWKLVFEHDFSLLCNRLTLIGFINFSSRLWNSICISYWLKKLSKYLQIGKTLSFLFTKVLQSTEVWSHQSVIAFKQLQIWSY